MSMTTSAEQNTVDMNTRLRCINAITPAIFAMHAQGAKADNIIWVLEWALTQLKGPTGIFASLMAEGGGHDNPPS
jgi:hypothetical protein